MLMMIVSPYRHQLPVTYGEGRAPEITVTGV